VVDRVTELRVVKDDKDNMYKFFYLDFNPSGQVIDYNATPVEIPVGTFPNKQAYIDYFTECLAAINDDILDIEPLLIEYFTNQALSVLTWKETIDGDVVEFHNKYELADIIKQLGYSYCSYKEDIYYVDNEHNIYKLNMTIHDLV